MRAMIRCRFIRRSALAVALVCSLALAAAAQQGYQQPPQAVLDVLHAPPTPFVSISPPGDRALLSYAERYPPIADLAQPMLRLAGLRVNPRTSGPHRVPRIVQMTLKQVPDGDEYEVRLPTYGRVGAAAWAPDGRRFAFTVTTDAAIELWVADAATGATRRLDGIRVNAVIGRGYDWMPDSRTLVVRTVPAGRGAPPQRPGVPAGPRVQENHGRPAPAPTFQDLLEDAHDADLFDHYATSQLALVDAESGRAANVGGPAILASVDASPDGRYFLVERIQRPYSYLLPHSRFPREVEVWDRAGKLVRTVASQPLLENIPLGGVPTGPRSVNWVPVRPATLVWVEALDEGNPRKRVERRDRVVWLAAPFTAEPAELFTTEHRFAGIVWGERGDLAILRDFDRDRLWTRAWFFNPQMPDEPHRLVWDMSTQERYRNPGTPEMRTLPNGFRAMQQHGSYIFLTGPGATPEGDRPFLDRFDTRTLEAERIFQSSGESHESVVTLLADDGWRFLTRYETPDEPPNWYLRTAAGDRRAFTSFPHPAPQLRGLRKELVRYQRADGVELSMTLWLPPDYQEGERRPGVLWAYPVEFADADTAGQVTGSPYRFSIFGGTSHLFFLLAGYVILDGATMPVIGDPETVNETYVEQIVSSAQAAIDKAAEMGVVDPERVGVGGHSYGAFMTANLLAHSDIFRAGIARSGAYNRTLTPFGFQRERRTLWQAQQTYLAMSPFMRADRIKTPILLIHGEADNNTGTFPMQSERMFHALKGNGATVRYVTLPHESHGYAARESVEHTLWEMLNWFDTHVKNAPPRRHGERAEAAK
jgi:dipeptidyl aminopeptidase/acylaminoacyl peptidase